MSDLIDREKAIEQMSLYGSVWMDYTDDMTKEQVAEKALRASKQALIEAVKRLPPAQPEIKPIEYLDCANAMLKMWMDNVVTDGEYNRIMAKLNAHWGMKNG